MSEWWTYTLGDFLMFAPRTYWRLVELHNAALWPAHLAMGLAGAAAAAAPWMRRAVPVAALVLAAAWITVGWEFHARRYAQVNWAAEAFAVAFIAEGVLWLLAAAWGSRASAPGPLPTALRRHAALAAWLFALVGYPLLGALAGRPWTQTELFGIVPDPTVMATLGVLVGAPAAMPRMLRFALWVVPVGWCAVGGATLLAMNEPTWPLLPLAGALAVMFALLRRDQFSGTNTQSSR